MQDNATVLDGLDGKVYLDDSGLTFERSKMRSAGRGVGTVHAVPWSAVRSATIEKNSLRVDVAGYDRPRSSTGDPNAVALKRGQQESGAAFVELVNACAAGDAAVPAFQKAAAPSAQHPETRSPGTEAPSRTWSDRIEGMAMFISGAGLVAFALASLVLLVLVIVLAFVIFV